MHDEELIEKLIVIVKNSPIYEEEHDDIIQALINMRDRELLTSRLFEEWDELEEWDEEEK
jgi:hypothetical protein